MSTILAYGDSNTWGLIPGSLPLTRFEEDKRWTGILDSEVPGLRIVEEGLCGRTTVYEDALRPCRNGLALLAGVIESHLPLDGAVLMLGTNDCKPVYGVSSHTIGKGIELCLATLEHYIAPSKILLISPIELGSEVYKPYKDPEFSINSVEVSKELKDVYSKIAQRRGNAFLAASDIAKADSADDEHLNEDGHRALAQAVLDKLREMDLA